MSNYCKNCGSKVISGSEYCNNCGVKINNEIETNSVNNETVTLNKNIDESSYFKRALLSFIFSIIGIFIASFILGPISIGLGIGVLNHNQVTNSNKGKGLSIAAIVIGSFDLIMAIIAIILNL